MGKEKTIYEGMTNAEKEVAEYLHFINLYWIFEHPIFVLDERNRLSHVNRYEEEFNEQWFKTYFEKALKLLQYLQNLNNIQLSQKIYDFIEDNKTVQYFSEEDINYLLSQES